MMKYDASKMFLKHSYNIQSWEAWSTGHFQPHFRLFYFFSSNLPEQNL